MHMAKRKQAATIEPETTPRQQETPKTGSKPKRQPRYNVILWDDDDHTYDYVIRMMHDLFGHPQEKGMQIATAVDKAGRAVCLTTTLEHAELKRDQIHAFGRDVLMEKCKGSMRASIEPVEET